MRGRTLFLALAVASLIVAGGADASRQAVRWRVGLRSFGPIRYGMTLREASRAVGARVEPGVENAAEDCSFTSVPGAPRGTAFMVTGGRLVRVDVDTAGIPTVSGAQVGWSEEQVRSLYPGQVRTEAHPYTGPEGHYLVFVARERADSAFGLIFETDGRRVLSYRAGRQPEVSWIEGCA